MHRTQDTYPLSHFRQNTGDHLKRIQKGAVETITQNGEAAMIVMSPERYDAMVHQLERGSLWSAAIARIGKESGRDAKEAVHSIARELDIDLK
jgi:PHD/YefM family antitoxin component YafN of YafNO toxin-antitoxin module